MSHIQYVTQKKNQNNKTKTPQPQPILSHVDKTVFSPAKMVPRGRDAVTDRHTTVCSSPASLYKQLVLCSTGVDNSETSSQHSKSGAKLDFPDKMSFPNTVQFSPGELCKTYQVTVQLLHLAKRLTGEKSEYETIPHLASHLPRWSELH